MLRPKAVIRISLLFAILAWVALTFTYLTYIYGASSGLDSTVGENVPSILFSLFILSLFIYFKFRIEKAESINFIDMLWKVFIMGLITTIVSLSFQLFLSLLGSNTKLAKSTVFLNFIYISNLCLFSVYLISTFVVWKRLILYQKSKFLLSAWKVFEYALLLSLAVNGLSVKIFENFQNVYLGMLLLIGLFLSANTKWVAYLNFKQKWKSILLIVLAMFYLSYFSFTLFTTAGELSEITQGFFEFTNSIFVTALVAFIFIYALFSLLVILFNLPTSSVFEQKLEEVMSFQKLSQSVQTEQSEERVYEILLESAVNTVSADAAWIESHELGADKRFYTHGIGVKDIEEMTGHFQTSNISGLFDSNTDKTRNMSKYLSSLKGSQFRSIVTFPIQVKGQREGIMVLLKDVNDGFNRENTNIIKTFANQAGISIENFRLVSEALQNERYKEELKIAKKVQSSLLPANLGTDPDFDIVAFSEAADEVGGDYYDSYRINEDKMVVIISDVSGKGTSAAFHMSQMKGVFHSLAQHDVSPEVFLSSANQALGRCLDRASFITTSYFVIDNKKKEVQFARAGHCPTLYLDSATGKADFFQNKGLGLGIIRNDTFENYIHTESLTYKKGDILLLYTDGITEAKNFKNEEYGYDRLRVILEENSSQDAEKIQEKLIEDLYSFSGTDAIDDDYTIVIIKFI